MTALIVTFIPAWVVLVVIAAWGSYRFSLRDPRSTSLVKVGFAGILLVAFAVFSSIAIWSPGFWGEGLLAHGLGLLFFWPMIILGVPLCVGSILGTATAMYRGRHN